MMRLALSRRRSGGSAQPTPGRSTKSDRANQPVVKPGRAAERPWRTVKKRVMAKGVRHLWAASVQKVSDTLIRQLFPFCATAWLFGRLADGRRVNRDVRPEIGR